MIFFFLSIDLKNACRIFINAIIWKGILFEIFAQKNYGNAFTNLYFNIKWNKYQVFRVAFWEFFIKISKFFIGFHARARADIYLYTICIQIYGFFWVHTPTYACNQRTDGRQVADGAAPVGECWNLFGYPHLFVLNELSLRTERSGVRQSNINFYLITIL